MTPRHHLNEATLVSLAAGALSAEMSAVAATHLLGCAHCRRLLADAESVGDALLARQRLAHATTESHAQRRREMLARLDEAVPPEDQSARPHRSAPEPADADCLPPPLQPYFGNRWSGLRWKWTAPGLHIVRASRPGQDKLIMLKVGAGRAMPVHSHQGTELTQILQGAYDDALGHFAAGDAADLDHETQHQPVASSGVPCICVAALDAPLSFPGWLARKLQPLVQL
jgi:putative transcriptional regulator